jgi:hypothetical protein
MTAVCFHIAALLLLATMCRVLTGLTVCVFWATRRGVCCAAAMTEIIDNKHAHCVIFVPNGSMLRGGSSTGICQERLKMAVERCLHLVAQQAPLLVFFIAVPATQRTRCSMAHALRRLVGRWCDAERK